MSRVEITKSLSPRRAKMLAKMNAVTDKDVATFIGRNANRFLPTWTKLRRQAAGERMFIWSWCWPAFLFGFAWFMYRKMYTIAAALFFTPIVLVLFTPIGGSSGVAYGGVLAVMGKSLYLNHARAKITKIRDRTIDEDEAVEKISRAGGISIAGGVFGGLIWFGCLIILFAATVRP